MPPRPWTRNPVDILQRLPQVAQQGGALALWGAWCVEALDYAVEIDDDFFAGSRMRGFHPDVIDLAHVRWSAGTASTAIDLCAAALGSWYCGVGHGDHQLDLRRIRPWARDKTVARTRASLPLAGRAWVRRTWTDPQYKTLLSIRNPFTHSRLPRLVMLSTLSSQGHRDRTAFPTARIAGRAPPTPISARQLVLLARDVARRHVQDFLDDVDAKRLGY
jgi:hypothetical protein